MACLSTSNGPLQPTPFHFSSFVSCVLVLACNDLVFSHWSSPFGIVMLRGALVSGLRLTFLLLALARHATCTETPTTPTSPNNFTYYLFSALIASFFAKLLWDQRRPLSAMIGGQMVLHLSLSFQPRLLSSHNSATLSCI